MSTRSRFWVRYITLCFIFCFLGPCTRKTKDFGAIVMCFYFVWNVNVAFKCFKHQRRKSVAVELNRLIADGTVTDKMLRLCCDSSRVDGKRAVFEDVERTDSPLFAAEAPKRCRRKLDEQFAGYAEQQQKIFKEAMASRLPSPAPMPPAFRSPIMSTPEASLVVYSVD